MSSINKTKLDKIIKNLATPNQSFKQINIYNAKALIMLRYLDMLNPKFGKAGTASQLLVLGVQFYYL